MLGEREVLIGCLPYAPQLGIEPATQACALTGNQTPNFSVYRTTPNHLSRTGQGRLYFLNVICL